MTEMTRKEKMAQEKAAWEAAQAAKKAAKQAAKQAKQDKQDKPIETSVAPEGTPFVETEDVKPEEMPQTQTGRKAPKPPKAPKPQRAPKTSKVEKTRGSQDQSGVSQSETLAGQEWDSVLPSAPPSLLESQVDAGLVVDLAAVDAKQARRVRTRGAKTSSKAPGVKKSKKKSVTYKTALRMGLSEPVANMIEEKNRILALWKSRKITPELAVSNLSVLQARDGDGSVWRLLPRYGGYALVRTGHDGVPSIVEPPRKRRAWPAVVGGLLFSILIILALWGVVNPATDGEERIDTPSTLVSGLETNEAPGYSKG
jgi:hypothetical protein